MTEITEFIQSLLTSFGVHLIILVASFVLAFFTFPFLIGMIQEAGLIKKNFSGEEIPAIAGLVFVVLIPFTTGLGLLLRIGSFTTINAFLFLFVLIGTGFLGLLDDNLGNHNIKGFRGHFSALLKEGKLTTGGFKALFGALIAFVFSIGSAMFIKTGWVWGNIFLNFLVVALAANVINVFDLRPGRAGKMYIVGFIIILALSKNFENYTGLFVPILAIMFYYLPFDLKGKVMMGDIGSNLLGSSLGIMMAWMFSDISKIFAVILMLGLQIAAEKYSFSEIIEKYSWLRYLDNIGRRQN